MEYYWELRSKNAQNIKARMCPLYPHLTFSKILFAIITKRGKNFRPAFELYPPDSAPIIKGLIYLLSKNSVVFQFVWLLPREFLWFLMFEILGKGLGGVERQNLITICRKLDIRLIKPNIVSLLQNNNYFSHQKSFCHLWTFRLMSCVMRRANFLNRLQTFCIQIRRQPHQTAAWLTNSHVMHCFMKA